MDGDLEQNGLTKLGVEGALCREYASDEKAFLGFLASSLQKALTDEVEVTQSGGFLSKKTLRAVTLTHGENRFTLEDPGRGPLQAKMTHVVRGIALKTETVSVEEWLAMVSEIVEEKTAQHSAARKALQDMLGLN